MISISETTITMNDAPIYQLKIILCGSEPPIWRRVQVPGNATLAWLHAVLQVTIGWTNSHLHQFRSEGNYYSDTKHNHAEFEDDPEILEASNFTLQQIAPQVQGGFSYEYDFGDSWEHEVIVEEILPSDSNAAKSAICLDGARACPPEDCGGVWGYAELLVTLKDRKHPEHKSMKEWLGREFDSEAFDVAKTNLWLRKLKWPRVTEAQLRKVLMGRDDYRE